MYNNSQKTAHNINVLVDDIILTPLTFATLLNEILKCLVYEKSQIPFPYQWLKSVINRKRTSNDAERKISFTVQKFFDVSSKAYDTLEEIMKNVRREFEKSERVSEVLIIFGSTPITPKEVISIKVPPLAKGHIEAVHYDKIVKYQHKILRRVFLSEEWLKSMSAVLPCTNMYLMLKKSHSDNDYFNRIRNYEMPTNVQNTVISLMYSKEDRFCCSNLRVFEDAELSSSSEEDDLNESLPNDIENSWFQSSSCFKGFKDCFINKISASELW